MTVRSVPVERIRLEGGYWNSVWKVRDGRGWLVEKEYAEPEGEPNPMYPILADHEAAALRHLAGTGTAPELVSYRPRTDDAPARVVYRFEPGTQWRRGVGDVARLLRRVHSLPAPRGLRQLHTSAAAALAHADSIVATVPDDVAAPLRAVRPDRASSTRPPRRSLVHTDCGPGNVIRTRRGPVLIDWQCPGVGDAVEDIACFLSPAMMILYRTPPHTAAAEQRFLDAYDDPAVTARYRRDGAAWHSRIAAYCLYRAHRLHSSDPAVAARYRAASTAEIDRVARW